MYRKIKTSNYVVYPNGDVYRESKLTGIQLSETELTFVNAFKYNARKNKNWLDSLLDGYPEALQEVMENESKKGLGIKEAMEISGYKPVRNEETILLECRHYYRLLEKNTVSFTVYCGNCLEVKKVSL